VCIYIYKIIIHYTHIYYVNTNFYFWMRLIAINRFTALIIIFIFKDGIFRCVVSGLASLLASVLPDEIFFVNAT